MGHTPHELAEEFPDKVNLIHDLNQSDGHFRRLAEEYHTINRAIHRAETNVEPTDHFHEEDMRKKRVALKDQIAAALSRAAAE